MAETIEDRLTKIESQLKSLSQEVDRLKNSGFVPGGEIDAELKKVEDRLAAVENTLKQA